MKNTNPAKLKELNRDIRAEKKSAKKKYLRHKRIEVEKLKQNHI